MNVSWFHINHLKNGGTYCKKMSCPQHCCNLNGFNSRYSPIGLVNLWAAHFIFAIVTQLNRNLINKATCGWSEDLSSKVAMKGLKSLKIKCAMKGLWSGKVKKIVDNHVIKIQVNYKINLYSLPHILI